LALCEVHRIVEGPADAPAVVLVNSLGSDLRMWDAQAAALRARFRVVRFDTRGHGRSPVPPGPYSLADLGGDVLGLLDELELARTSICGVSMGGAISMWAAVHAPERVERLAVCFSAAWFGPPQGWLERAEIVRTRGLEAIVDAVVGRWLSDAAGREQPQLIDQMRAMFLATPAEGYAACCEAMADIDLRERLGEITAPALVVSGSEDPAAPPENGRLIAAGISGARFVELAGAAHLGNVERAAQFNELLLEHLDRASTASEHPTPPQAKETS
jgi:3-oxoadipate enol-lactonase